MIAFRFFFGKVFFDKNYVARTTSVVRTLKMVVARLWVASAAQTLTQPLFCQSGGQCGVVYASRLTSLMLTSFQAEPIDRTMSTA